MSLCQKKHAYAQKNVYLQEYTHIREKTRVYAKRDASMLTGNVCIRRRNVHLPKDKRNGEKRHVFWFVFWQIVFWQTKWRKTTCLRNVAFGETRRVFAMWQMYIPFAYTPKDKRNFETRHGFAKKNIFSIRDVHMQKGTCL